MEASNFVPTLYEDSTQLVAAVADNQYMHNMKFVYVDVSHKLIEFDPKTGEGEELDGLIGKDLETASEAVEDEPACGVVAAYAGADGWWHFDHYLTKDERKTLGLTAYNGEFK